MTGTLDIVLNQASNVLMVPTTAVSGSASTSFVRVMQDGKPVFRQVADRHGDVVVHGDHQRPDGG